MSYKREKAEGAINMHCCNTQHIPEGVYEQQSRWLV